MSLCLGACCRGCSMEAYSSLNREQVVGNIPMMFITFPSAKDPTAAIRHPGNTFNPQDCCEFLNETSFTALFLLDLTHKFHQPPFPRVALLYSPVFVQVSPV